VLISGKIWLVNGRPDGSAKDAALSQSVTPPIFIAFGMP
jgi:hypothetical protein